MGTIPAADRARMFDLQRANRLRAAEVFADLDPEQWTTPSLCAGWTVREIAAHLVPPARGHRLLPLLLDVARFRGDLDRMVDVRTRQLAQRPTSELVGLLRERSGVPLDAPFLGPIGPLVDSAIHLRDAARPLGSSAVPDPRSWPLVLDFLVSPEATKGFVAAGRLDRLHLVATDLDWAHGQGPRVEGPAEALALAMSGRGVAVDDLLGPGAAVLGSRS